MISQCLFLESCEFSRQYSQNYRRYFHRRIFAIHYQKRRNCLAFEAECVNCLQDRERYGFADIHILAPASSVLVHVQARLRSGKPYIFYLQACIQREL